MKVALVYDRVNKWGGAERVLLALHKLFPEAPLFTSVYNPKTASWASVFEIKTSFLQNFPFSEKHELYGWLMPIVFESFSFDDFDVVISVTSEAAKGIITKPSTLHICLCLTPTRYLWSGYKQYFKNPFFKVLSAPIVWYLRVWDKIAAQRPDSFIAISEEVQKRIRKYYGRESKVIYPPLTLDSRFKIQDSRKDEVRMGSRGKDYFLVVSRLSQFTRYKRVDLAIAAANKLGFELHIVGDGDIQSFKEKAKSNVKFLGKISDAELTREYINCKALIFPALEDFGLAMVEAQSFGKPVIAYKAGGALEIIQEGKTGLFFEKQTVESLVTALENFINTRYNSLDCIKNAERFSFLHFETAIRKFITQNKKFV